MIKTILKNKLIAPTILLFIALSAWWAVLNLKGLAGDTDQAELFSAFYGFMALFGGVVGIFVSAHWGGWKSLIGKSIIMASLGLLAQEFGQIAYSLYTYLFHTEIPYPSAGDIGYFGSIIFYVLAGRYLIKALSLKKTLSSLVNKLIVLGVPLLLLIGSYVLFLKDYEFDFSNPLVVFLDFGYPLGQAVYISLALLAFILSRNYLGGLMKPVIMFVIFALFVQYLADFTFLYQVSHETWQTAGINDYMYLFSYFIMTLSLLYFESIALKLKNTTDEEKPVINEQQAQS